MFISKEMVEKAYRCGIARLVKSPHKDGTVCQIAEGWFYFGGLTAEELDPAEYRKQVPEADIIDEIYDALQGLYDLDPVEYEYYWITLKEKMPVWAEIRITHEDNGFWAVDAWETADDGEEGKVIAYIDDLTGRVVYTEPLARVDKYAQEVINDCINHLECPLKIEKKPACIDIHMPARHGTLIASLEPDSMSGSGYDAVFVGMEPSKDPYVYFDLAAVRSHYNTDTVDILTWADICDEEWTDKKTISKKEIDDLVESCQ